MELVENGGEVAKKSFLEKLSGDSPRKRGVKQGLFIFSLSFLIVPIISILTIAARSEPFLVAISAILLVVGGLLRVLYALLLQSNDIAGETAGSSPKVMSGNNVRNALPTRLSEPISAYEPPIIGNWRDTNDLIPATVTEETTHLLNQEFAKEMEVK